MMARKSRGVRRKIKRKDEDNRRKKRAAKKQFRGKMRR